MPSARVVLEGGDYGRGGSCEEMISWGHGRWRDGREEIVETFLFIAHGIL